MGGIGVLLRLEKQPDTPAKRKKLHKALWKRIERRLRGALKSELTRSILVHYIGEQTRNWFDDPLDGVFGGVSFTFRDGGDDFPMKYASYHWTDRACVDPAVFADLQEIAKKHDAELQPRTWYPPETIYFPLDGGDALASISDDYLDVWTDAGLVRIDFAECPILDYAKRLVAEQRCLCEVCRKPADEDPGPILDAETLSGIAGDVDVPDAPELFARLDEAIDDPDLELPVDEIATLRGIARRKAELLVAIGFENDPDDMRLPAALVKLGARWAAPVLFGPAIYKSTSYDVRETLRESMRSLLAKPPVVTTGELLDADGVPILVFHFVGEYRGEADAKQMRADTDALLAAHPEAQGMVLDATELSYASGPGLDDIVLKGRPRVWAGAGKSRGLRDFIETERGLSPAEWLFPSVRDAMATVRSRVVDGYVLHTADETTVVETGRPEPGGRRIECDSEDGGAPVALSQLVDRRGVLIEKLTTWKDGSQKRVQYPRLDARGHENEACLVGGQLTAWADGFVKVDFNPVWRERPMPSDWIDRVAARPHLLRVSLDDTSVSTAEILQLLERCPHLEELYLHRLKLDAELFTSPLFGKLKRLQLHGADTPPGAPAQLAALHPWLVIDPPPVFSSWSRVVDADGIAILVVSFAGEYGPDMAVSMKSACTTGLVEHPDVRGIVLDATYMHDATGKEVGDLVPIGRPFVWAVSPLSRGLFRHIRADKNLEPREWLFPSVEAAIGEVRARIVGDWEIHGVTGILWETWTREPRGRRKSGERTIDGEQLVDETLFDLQGRMIEDLYRKPDGRLTRLDEYPIRDAAGGENAACRFGARLVTLDGQLRTVDFSTDHVESPLPADWIDRIAAHPTVDKVILDGTGVATSAVLQLLERCPHLETLWLNTLIVDQALFDSPLLAKLKQLYLWNASIPPGAAKALAAKYPALDIQPKSVLE
jgi:hypothetical protein